MEKNLQIHMAGIDTLDRDDRTPMPVEVTTEQSPESTRTYPGVALARERAMAAQNSRGLFRKVLPPTIGLVVGATALFGSDVVDTVENHHRAQARVAIAKAEKNPKPASLKYAQFMATVDLFKSGGTDVDEERVERIINSPGYSKTLNVEKYLPGHIQTSDDGETFLTEGQRYGMSKMTAEDGSVYVIANQTITEERLFAEDITHVANSMLVGGAHNDATSDRNKDGVVTPEEVNESADLSARENLRKALASEGAISRR